MELKSPAFGHGQPIPEIHACEGEDISPELSWSDVPGDAKTLALVVDDPDAPGGTFTHWVIYNIPAKAEGLPEGVPNDEILENGARQGVNDFRNYGYGGPCPPGGTHRYFFRLYALDSKLPLQPGASKSELVEAMEGNILEETDLMGTYAHREK
ncbi:MAG: YbhB/YbcL family Raf kinase inhibitor-like protein [Alphaproteobacteria bacterium]|nr:YbhB/YbcL family Raf kinase inhibitor-like protein [Alphaproteobacteria bacterium]